ncbi:MAG: tetratricopeptide repeat protein [candidate division NC10 bacterium]|nr:tetratricopeptide repeat protein [candidate division NC10 bacterium]
MKRMGMSGRTVWPLVLLGSVLVILASPAWGQIPTESDVYVDRGIVAYGQGQYQDALQAFQEAVRMNPDNVNALYYVGMVYLAIDQPAAAQEALEQAQKLNPNDADVAYQLAVVYFTQQQYDKSDALFQGLYTRDPRRQNLGYYLGFLEYRQQRFREALRYFRANVASDENFAQLNRFYSGLALSALGMPAEARTEIEEALRLQPMSPLTGPAERFRDVLGTAAMKERNFHVDAKIGTFYDNNVSVIADPSGDPVAILSREAKHRSTGELGYVRFEYTPLRTVDWEGVVAASVLGTYENNLSNYNVLSPSIMGSLSYKDTLWGKQTIYNLTYLYDYMLLDDPYLTRHTVAPAMTLIWNGSQVTQPILRYQFKSFLNQHPVTSADNRDSNNYMGGFTHYMQFEGGHYVKGGYQLDYEAAVGTNWKYVGNRFLVGTQYTLPWRDPWWDLGLRFRYDFDFQFRNYTHQNDYLPLTDAPSTYRRDREMNNIFSLAKDLPNDLTLALEYLYTWNHSNLPVYGYSRSVVTLSLSWRY